MCWLSLIRSAVSSSVRGNCRSRSRSSFLFFIKSFAACNTKSQYSIVLCNLDRASSRAGEVCKIRIRALISLICSSSCRKKPSGCIGHRSGGRRKDVHSSPLGYRRTQPDSRPLRREYEPPIRRTFFRFVTLPAIRFVLSGMPASPQPLLRIEDAVYSEKDT